VPFPGSDGQGEFFFLFDYGDEWRFRVKLVRATSTLTPGECYPRIVASHGDVRPQYADVEEE
jgi:hypothetical protein